MGETDGTKNKEKQRSSNFELLRIICMVLIVAYHYCVHGNNHTIFQTDITPNQVIAFLFGSWGLLGVNCFIFISAYFLIGSRQFRTIKLVKLLLQTSFYSTVFAIIMIVSHQAVLSSQDIVHSVFSPLFNQYWFVTAYCLLYTIYPFLNHIIENMPAKYLSRLILILTVFVPTYRVFVSQAPIDAFLFFIYLYLIMGFLKQKDNNWFELNAKKGFLLTTLFIILYEITISAIGTYGLQGFHAYTSLFTTRYSPLMVLDAIFLFYIFKNFRMGVSRVINSLAGTTLGIYLFHEYPLLRPILWDGFLNVDEVYQSNYFTLYLLLSVIGIYTAGTIIELLRIHLIEKPLLQIKLKPLEAMSKKWDQWINGDA